MIRTLLIIVFGGLSALSLAAWYEFYFRWRDCFNEEGRCFDPETAVVYHEQSGMVWMLAAIVFAVVAAALFWLRRPKA